MKATVVMLSALSRIVSLLLIAICIAGNLVHSGGRLGRSCDLEINLFDIANDCRPVMPARRLLCFATDSSQRIDVTKSAGCCFDPISERNYESVITIAHQFGRTRAVRTE